jgi:hypothetical protein
VFVGEGLGIPGLPHRITTTTIAAAPELVPLLAEAVAAGVYVPEVQTAAALPETDYPAGAIDLADGVDTDEASLAGQALRQRRGSKGK